MDNESTADPVHPDEYSVFVARVVPIGQKTLTDHELECIVIALKSVFVKGWYLTGVNQRMIQWRPRAKATGHRSLLSYETIDAVGLDNEDIAHIVGKICHYAHSQFSERVDRDLALRWTVEYQVLSVGARMLLSIADPDPDESIQPTQRASPSE